MTVGVSCIIQKPHAHCTATHFYFSGSSWHKEVKEKYYRNGCHNCLCS